MTTERPTEEELLRRWRDSDSEEDRRLLLERILSPYLGRVAAWALRFARDPETAREVAQEALLAVCSHLDRFRGESRFSTWLYTIVRNQAFKQMEKAAGRRETSIDPLGASQAADDPARSHERSLQRSEVRELIASTLSPLEARIFLLHFGLDVPLAVLDRQLELTNRSGARAHLVSAKRKLRRKLEQRERSAEARFARADDVRRQTREPNR